jgi:hypothetical protein
VPNRGQQLAHRASYEAFIGPIPCGYDVDHRCHCRNCVNPTHLEAVWHRENARRSTSPPAKNASKPHCPQGHPYSQENTYHRPDGRRVCRTCDREHSRRKRQQRRATKNHGAPSPETTAQPASVVGTPPALPRIDADELALPCG